MSGKRVSENNEMVDLERDHYAIMAVRELVDMADSVPRAIPRCDNHAHSKLQDLRIWKGAERTVEAQIGAVGHRVGVAVGLGKVGRRSRLTMFSSICIRIGVS